MIERERKEEMDENCGGESEMDFNDRLLDAGFVNSTRALRGKSSSGPVGFGKDKVLGNNRIRKGNVARQLQ